MGKRKKNKERRREGMEGMREEKVMGEGRKEEGGGKEGERFERGRE